MQKADLLRFAMAITAAAFLALQPAARAQGGTTYGVSAKPSSDAPYVIPTDAVLRSFDSALTDLARQGLVAIVTEDTPIHPHPSDEALGNVKAGLKSLEPATFADALEAVTKAYDYEALPDPKGNGSTVVLVKRYSDPDDVPFVTFDEGVDAIRTLTRRLDLFDPHLPIGGPDKSLPVLTLLESLDADEYEAASGKSGLSVASLGEEQKELVSEWVEDQYLGTILNNLAKINELIRKTRDARSSYRWMKWMESDTKIFGVQLPSGQHGDLQQFGLSHGFLPQFIGGASVNTVVPALSGSFIEEIPTRRGQHTMTEANEEATARIRTGVERYLNGKPWPDPTAPEPGEREPTLSRAITLGKALASLNAAGPAPSPVPAPKFSVNPALAEKVVGIFDPLKRLTPSGTMQALATAYGLRVLRGEDGSDQLTLPAMPRTERISDIAPAIRAVLPAPWLRFQKGSMRRETATAVEMIRERPGMRAAGAQFVAGVAEIEASPRAEASRHQALVRRLRVALEPLLARSPSEQIPVTAAGPEADRLLALILVNEQLYTLDVIVDSDPRNAGLCVSALEDLDKCSIKGKLHDGGGGPSLSISVPDKDGVLRTVYGVH